MKSLFVAVLALAVAASVAGVASAAWMTLVHPPASPTGAVPACGAPPPLTGYGLNVPAGRFVEVSEVGNVNSNPYGGPIPQSRLSVWAQSNSTFYLYVMTPSDYGALGWTSNATGNASHSTAPGPAHSFVWGSGPVTAANHTVLIGNGVWYVVVYDPGSRPISVGVVTESCNAP